jgi:hypothetical protein
VDAFLTIPLFKRTYEEFRGKELPPEFGMKNALRNQFGVVPNRVDLAYRVLMESAEQAGFFETRMGAKTHLILPAFRPGTPMPTALQEGLSDAATESSGTDASGGGGSGEGGDGRGTGSAEMRMIRSPAANQLDDVKAKYIATLIKLFEDKSANGELDEKLMERIERLLGT